MKFTIDSKHIIISALIMLLIGGFSVTGQGVQVVEFEYIPNDITDVRLYPDSDAPILMQLPAGQTLMLYQPFSLNDLLWWAAIDIERTKWIAFSSVGRCERIPFGEYRIRQ